MTHFNSHTAFPVSTNGTSHATVDVAASTMSDGPVQLPSPVDAETTTAEPNDIDRVRDVLFGTHAREFDRRFRANERKLDELGAAVQRLNERMDHEVSEMQAAIRHQHMQTMMRVEDVQRAAHERLHNHQRETGQRLDGLSAMLTELTDLLDRTKLDQEQMGELLMDMGTRLKRAAKAQMAAAQNRAKDAQHS